MSPFYFSKPFHFLFSSLLLLLVFHIPTANAQINNEKPLDHFCENTTTYTNTSTFGTNLKLLHASLASNSSLNRGFYNSIIGQGSNTVYGQVLCRGDSESKVCQDCINKASDGILSLCSGRRATIWYDTCQLRYSDTNFFGNSTSSLYFLVWSVVNMTDADAFGLGLRKLLNDLAHKTEAQPWRRNFVTDSEEIWSFGGTQYLYGLVQCVPDIPGTQCLACLNNAMSNIPGAALQMRRGGRVIGDVCGLRFEITAFSGESKVADPAPSPPRPPSTDTSSPTNQTTSGRGNIVLIVVPAITGAIILSLIIAFLRIRKTHLKTNLKKKTTNIAAIGQVIEGSVEFLLIDFETIRAAIDDFSDENKLGQGGFGVVYKGTLQDGREIAVKRLSINSGQGAEQFRNEVALVAKLQHRNLVRIYGCCVEGEEKLLVYEYMPNKSLDNFLFGTDPVKRLSLNWECRLKIIGGIARGLLYLHEDSRLKIIHRDLKTGNILLDSDMIPKISDFGMAKIFGADQTQGNTNRIAGTFGYMAPEYVMHGQFSIKSDVFSFGVLFLEILSGLKNIYESNRGGDLLSYVWKAWNGGNVLEIIDSSLSGHFSTSEAMRCIHIGLLCVQEDPTARPTMSSVVLMLTSFSTTLPAPSAPAFFISTGMGHSSQENNSDSSQRSLLNVSTNDVSITELEPR